MKAMPLNLALFAMMMGCVTGCSSPAEVSTTGGTALTADANKLALPFGMFRITTTKLIHPEFTNMCSEANPAAVPIEIEFIKSTTVDALNYRARCALTNGKAYSGPLAPHPYEEGTKCAGPQSADPLGTFSVRGTVGVDTAVAESANHTGFATNRCDDRNKTGELDELDNPASAGFFRCDDQRMHFQTSYKFKDFKTDLGAQFGVVDVDGNEFVFTRIE